MTKRHICLCFFALVCAGLRAQRDSLALQELDEVVVSDSRFELKRENSGKTVIKITSEELERNQGKSIAEIINTKSGIEISGSRGVQGSVLGVFARGGRGRQVLILIDGVRVSDPSSFSAEYDLRLLATSNIESIEIVKGAASTLYGTNAATAVINIVTKNPANERISGNITSSVGTNQTTDDQNFNISDFSNNARISGTIGRLSYSGGIAQRYSDGLSAIITPENQEDLFSNTSLDARFRYRFNKVFDIAIYGNQSKMKTGFDESFGLVDAPYQFLSKQERVGIASTYNYSNRGSLHFNGAYTTYDSESKSAFPNVFQGENRVFDFYNKYVFNDKFHTILGLNYIQDKTDFATVEQFKITDPYLNVVYVSDFGLNINTGARLNSHSEYGTNFVYNLNPSFVIKANEGYFKLLASYATSYITPSLTQLFGNFGANAELEPEDNRTIEGGIEYVSSQKLRVGVVYFNREEENFVFFDNATSTYQNATDTVNAQGVELELTWSPTTSLGIAANYTFTERKGDNAIRIPKHKINALLSYQFSKRLNASMHYALTGERSDTDFGSFPFEDIALEPFSLVDLNASFEMLPNKLSVFFTASNLLNKQYTEVLGFTTRGRNIRMGFNLTL